MRLKQAAAGIVLGLVAIALPGSASALVRVDYTNAAVDQAVAANAPIIIGVWADWCGICQTQIGIIEELADDPRFADVVVIEVNYDTQRHIMIRYNVSFRSTVIAWRDGHEIRRLNAVTDRAEIEALLVDVVAARAGM